MKQEHPPIKFGKTGVLLINLGTPDSTSWLDIRKYLKEFLSDRRVIEVNPIIWQIILNLFILTFRPSKTAKAYKEIWMKDENMSPLLYYTKKQTEKTSEYFKGENLIKSLDVPVQGGLDPKILLSDKENLRKQIKRYLNIFKDHPYVFNLGHGILPETEVEMVYELVETVRNYK